MLSIKQAVFSLVLISFICLGGCSDPRSESEEKSSEIINQSFVEIIAKMYIAEPYEQVVVTSDSGLISLSYRKVDPNSYQIATYKSKYAVAALNEYANSKGVFSHLKPAEMTKIEQYAMELGSEPILDRAPLVAQSQGLDTQSKLGSQLDALLHNFILGSTAIPGAYSRFLFNHQVDRYLILIRAFSIGESNQINYIIVNDNSQALFHAVLRMPNYITLDESLFELAQDTVWASYRLR